MTGVVGNYVCASTQCAHVYLKNIGDKKKRRIEKQSKQNEQTVRDTQLPIQLHFQNFSQIFFKTNTICSTILSPAKTLTAA